MNKADLAQRLRDAYKSEPIDPFGSLLDGVDQAYAVQEQNTQHWLKQGRKLAGRKIGLTAPSVQKQLGVDQPDYGMLFEDMRLAIGEPLTLTSLLQPKIEAEIAFVMNGDVDDPHVGITELMSNIAYMLPALEIVDSRVRDWKISLNDTVADNASSAKYLIGARPVSLDALSLTDVKMELSANSEVVSNGTGGDCLGHPINAVLWLARTMAASGRPLKENDLVLSGALGPMVTAAPGALECRIEGFETIRLNVE